jgi:hypothetical protein
VNMVKESLASLQSELKESWERHRRWQRFNSMMAGGLMLTAIVSSVVVSVLAILNVEKVTIALAALVPGLVVAIASGFNPGGRADWHERRKNAMNELRRRLQYETSDPPTAEEMKKISEEWRLLEREYQTEKAGFVIGPDSIRSLGRVADKPPS